MFTKKSDNAETMQTKAVTRESLKRKLITGGPNTMIELTTAKAEMLFSDTASVMDEVRAAHEKNQATGAVKEPDHKAHLDKQVASGLTFEQAARPLMQYLADNHCPHHTVIVSATHAELLQGQMGFNTVEFVKD